MHGWLAWPTHPRSGPDRYAMNLLSANNIRWIEFEIGMRAAFDVMSYVTKRLLGFPQTPLSQAAIRSITVCQGSEFPAITPYFWEEHLPRVLGSATYDAVRVINEDLNRKTFRFEPVVVYWLRDATLLDGSVYSRSYRHELRPVGRRSRIGFDTSGLVGEVDRASLVSTCAGSTWWGHWIEDEVPLQMLAEKFAPPVAFSRKIYRDESVYRSVFGIAEPERFNVAVFRELLFIDEFAQNPNKTKRYRLLRSRLAQYPAGHDRVYLRRGTTGVRRVLVNESEVVGRLERLGFKTVNVATSSARAIMSVCRGASVVVSVEGSHLAPLLYLMQDFATMVILNPPYRVHTTVADIGVFCGLSSGMFVCEPEGDSRTDFRADPDELARFVDDAVAFGRDNEPRLISFLASVMRLDTSALVIGETSTGSGIDFEF